MMAVNKDQILEAAAQVFRQYGFHGASMADIADAVGLQKPTLYHHFGSKQEILVELLDRALEMVTENMAGVMVQPVSPEEKLRLAMQAYLQTLSAYGDQVSVLLLEYRSLEPEYYSRHIPVRDRFEKMWRDLIQEGVDAGVFDCDNVPLTVRGLMGVMNWSITWYRPDGGLTVGDIASHFTNLFLIGIQKRR